MNTFRIYQSEADNAIFDELIENDKCLVKMFCGTGKSRLMRYCRIAQGKPFVVYVVPSLSLLEQFYADYLQDYASENILRISSEEGSTTEFNSIVNFLRKPENKIICITYQSFETLVHLLGDTKIDVCIFDEAHHVVGKTYQTLIFDSNVCEKQIFFTATPKNANGVIMYDKDNLDAGMCGNLVYDYSYFKGVLEGYLNPFEIRIDFYTENTNASVYEAMARAILASGNNRVLTFHADVNGDRTTSVLQFVDEAEFIVAFNKVLTEFPEKVYKKIQMIGLSAEIHMKTRKRILTQFDTTPDNEVIVISSCQTIGEGIDTKNANMCVFVDPKSSFVAITQNIGRIVRKIFGQDKPNSTILIPCWVDKTKYLECDGDKDKCDEVIREDVNKGGNFNGILNVMSALKQEDKDIFDVCLNYPINYSPQEIEGNLSKHGYQLEQHVSLVESLEHLLDSEIELDDFTDEELLARTAEENNVTIEVHSDSLETPIEYYAKDEGKDVIRMFKSYDEENDEVLYQPIVKKDGTKRNTDNPIEPLRRDNRFNVNVHTNPDVKVLWNLKDGFDLSKDICSCVIDCEILDMWPQKFEELKAFIAANEITPNQHANDVYEKHLGQWLSTQQKKYKNKYGGMKNKNRYNLWTQFLEEYNSYRSLMSDEMVWLQKLEKIKTFVDKNKRRPTQQSKNKEEKNLGSWLSNQTTHYKTKSCGMKDEVRYNLFTTFLEEYKEYFMTDDDKWFKSFEELKMFISANKKRPLQSVKNEKNMFDWFGTQHKHYKTKTAGMKDEVRYNLFTTFLEEYKEYFMTDDDKWFKSFEELKMFISANKKRPNKDSKNTKEKMLGTWISNQTRHYKNKTMGMQNKTRYNLFTTFLEEYKEYFMTDDVIWLQNFEELKSFIDTNNKKPPSDKNKNVSKLAHWLFDQKKSYEKKYGGDELRYKLWTQFLEEYKEYLLTNDEKWFLKFEELKTFVDKNKRKPSDKSKNKEEKLLGSWLRSQLTHYKSKTSGMKDEERYNLWTQFLEEYKEYFNPKEEKCFSPIEEIIVKTKQKKSAKLTKINPNPKETKEDIFQRTKPLITQFHNKFCKMRSDNLANHFQQNPSDFAEYHRVRDECFKTFEPADVPCNRVIAELEKIKTKRGGKHVVDMGCGTAKISEHFKDDPRFKFINYDHVAINDTVQVCDISHMPLEDDSVDICIMSLALWGSNCEEYIKEAYRVLETNSTLYIIDSTKRWSQEGTQDATILKEMLETAGFQITTETIDKWCYFKGTKVPYNLS